MVYHEKLLFAIDLILSLAVATLILVGGGIIAVAKISGARNRSSDHAETPASQTTDASLLSQPK